MIWDELDAANPLPICSCDKCTCQVIRRIHKMQEENRLIQFLMKLNPEFNNVRGNILLQAPLPPLSMAYRLLMQEERQRKSIRLIMSMKMPQPSWLIREEFWNLLVILETITHGTITGSVLAIIRS